MFMAVVALYLAACTSILHGLTNRETVELVGLAAAAVAGTSFAFVFLPRWIRYRAGPLVVLLRVKKSRTAWFAGACLLPLVVILFVPMVSLLPAWQEPKIGGTTWPSGVRGLLVLWLTQNACFAVNSIVRRSWALCDRGLVRDGMFFIPWRKLRKNTWSTDKQGNLVATVSRWRVVITVPPEQREAVEALLQEKLGNNSST
jgi:hypothetical protein